MEGQSNYQPFKSNNGGTGGGIRSMVESPIRKSAFLQSRTGQQTDSQLL